MAEDAWNRRDPEAVSLAYTTNSIWRNRSQFLTGNAEEETTGLAALQAAPEAAALPPSAAEVPALEMPEPSSLKEPHPDQMAFETPDVGGLTPAEGWGAATEEALGPRRVIEEVFVCSQQGAVLHGWPVRNGDLWINFFEFLSQKSRRLSMGLPLGVFERIEVGDGVTRLSILIDDDRGVLVRSREEGTTTSGPAGTAGGAVSQQRFAEWLDAVALPAGVLAATLRFPDQTVRVRVMQDGVGSESLDNASRCAADVFRVLRVHRLPSLRLRWGYRGGVMACARRPDDVLLAVLMDGVTAVGPLLAEFAGLEEGV